MPFAGPNNSASNVSDGSVGISLWSSPGNVVSLGGGRATTFAGAGSSSDTSFFLRCQNFGFAIPSGAIINGILLEINRFGFAEPRDNQLRLLNVTGGAVGEDKSSPDAWPLNSGATYTSFGGPTDMWGTTLTPRDINSSSFGVRLQLIRNITTKTSRTMQVDHLRMKVYYSLDVHRIINTSPTYSNNITANNGIDIINLPNYNNISIENVEYLDCFTNQYGQRKPRNKDRR